MSALITILSTFTFNQILLLIVISACVIVFLAVMVVFIVKASGLEKIGISGLEFDQNTPPPKKKVRRVRRQVK